jgi:hypothetical protein
MTWQRPKLPLEVAQCISLRANQAVTRFELDYGFNSISPCVRGDNLRAKYQWHTIVTITSYQHWSSSEGKKGGAHYDIDQQACFAATHQMLRTISRLYMYVCDEVIGRPYVVLSGPYKAATYPVSQNRITASIRSAS